MTTGVKAASPYGTPNAAKRASPLSSPLIRCQLLACLMPALQLSAAVGATRQDGVTLWCSVQHACPAAGRSCSSFHTGLFPHSAAPHGPAHPRSDPSKLEALNLNPGLPRVDEQTRREFEQFKAQQAASKGCAVLRQAWARCYCSAVV